MLCSIKPTGNIAFGFLVAVSLAMLAGCGEAGSAGDDEPIGSVQQQICNPGGAVTGLCSFDSALGIVCATFSPATYKFNPTSVWSNMFVTANGFGPSSMGFWGFSDLNGDRKIDVCALNSTGVICALSTGSAFGGAAYWSTSFSLASNWGLVNGASNYISIAYPDVNHDGKADICGRDADGIICALSNGTSFGPATIWQPAFSDANGWNGNAYWETIQFPDVNGDFKADVCGRGAAGIYCALSNGTNFGPATLWQPAFSDANGWASSPLYYQTIQFPDVNGDSKADVCGRGADGIWCALSDGTKFGAASLWNPSFSDVNNWEGFNSESIQYPDINGDGKADVCGAYDNGDLWCATSIGTAFSLTSTWGSVGPTLAHSIEFAELRGSGHIYDVVTDIANPPTVGKSLGSSFSIDPSAASGAFDLGQGGHCTDAMTLVSGGCSHEDIPRRWVTRLGQSNYGPL